MTEAFQHRSSTCVVVGAFAPATFHPLWFEMHGLLGTQEAQTVANQDKLLVTDDIALFKVAGFDFDIRPDRIQIGTAQENLFPAVRDLVCSTLNILESNNVRSVGINWAVHIPLGSEQEWHTAGHRMIPINFWKSAWSKHAGMRNVTVELQREDEKKGYVQVTTQPSNAVPHGLYITVNDHYEVATEGKPAFGRDAENLIVERWSASESMTHSLFDKIRKEVTRG